MPNTFLIFSPVAKAAGFLAARNAVSFLSPFDGVILFFGATLVQDTVERIGDILDNGRPDWCDEPSYRLRAHLPEVLHP